MLGTTPIYLASFPLIDTSSVTDMSGAWHLCRLTSFPAIDTFNAVNLSNMLKDEWILD